MKIYPERKFTIIIPTRERADTLIHTIASAIAQDYDNLEILVSDNASNDCTSESVSKFNDPRIRYVNTGKRVSMSHNWEYALEHVTEGWVTVLGDDDAILPGALGTVNKIIDETDTLAIRSNGCEYYWPKLLGKQYGKLSISSRKGYKRVQSKHALIKVLNGELHYNNLPMLYNGGFIDISLIKKAKSITGDFFLSMTPDVYSAMVFSLLTNEYIYSEEPLAINGASQHSGGTAAFEKSQRKRSYDPAEKFYSERNIRFHHNLPLLENQKPVRSIQAVIYEAYLQAEPFHDQKNLTVSPGKQLELILKSSSRHYDEIHNWGLRFAELHKINYEEISKKAKEKGDNIALKGLLTMLVNETSTLRIYGNQNVPLTDVYQASIIAAAIKSVNPGIHRRISNVLKRLRKH